MSTTIKSWVLSSWLVNWPVFLLLDSVIVLGHCSQVQGSLEGPGKGQSSAVLKNKCSQAEVWPHLVKGSFVLRSSQNMGFSLLLKISWSSFFPSSYPSSITQKSGAESQARMERVEQLKAELENMNHQTSTLEQQIDQYRHACSRATEEQGKMK